MSLYEITKSHCKNAYIQEFIDCAEEYEMNPHDVTIDEILEAEDVYAKIWMAVFDLFVECEKKKQRDMEESR